MYDFVKNVIYAALKVKPVLKPLSGLDGRRRRPLCLSSKLSIMKKALLFFLLTTIILGFGCDQDPFPLSLDRFDVRWFDDDQSGTQTPGDALQFIVQVSGTDPDPDDQFVTDWEFSYSVNGAFVGVLQGDSNIRNNSVNLDAEIAIGNLPLPFAGGLLPGDVIEFRFWAVDNWGQQVEQTHRYVLE
jgi:hypothetical protein